MTLASLVLCAVVQHLMVPSASMKRDIPVAVVLPSNYAASEVRRPVITCLHGVGGTYSTFLERSTFDAVDTYGFIAVLPQSGPSWWFDSPVVATNRFETFVARELTAYIDGAFRTAADRNARAVVGASMGGHGACWIGFRNRDMFGAVGNIYGGVELAPFAGRFGIERVLGPLSGNESLWRRHSVLAEAEKLKPGEVRLITCVGTRDFFLEANRRMHSILKANGVEHEYLEITGGDLSRSSHHENFKRMVEPIVYEYICRHFRLSEKDTRR